MCKLAFLPLEIGKLAIKFFHLLDLYKLAISPFVIVNKGKTLYINFEIMTKVSNHSYLCIIIVSMHKFINITFQKIYAWYRKINHHHEHIKHDIQAFMIHHFGSMIIDIQTMVSRIHYILLCMIINSSFVFHALFHFIS